MSGFVVVESDGLRQVEPTFTTWTMAAQVADSYQERTMRRHHVMPEARYRTLTNIHSARAAARTSVVERIRDFIRSRR